MIVFAIVLNNVLNKNTFNSFFSSSLFAVNCFLDINKISFSLLLILYFILWYSVHYSSNFSLFLFIAILIIIIIISLPLIPYYLFTWKRKRLTLHFDDNSLFINIIIVNAFNIIIISKSSSGIIFFHHHHHQW